MNKLKKIWNNRRIFRSILYSIYFNFHYLPFNQAVIIPILLYKPRLFKLNGNIKIEGGKVRFGMIRLGFPTVSLYPNTGIMFENHGGTIRFNGQCRIGNNSYLSIGSKAIVEFGDRFSATTTLRLASYNKIVIGDNTSFGWDILIMDTDFHKLTKETGGFSRSFAPIYIGANNWFGNGCRIMKKHKRQIFVLYLLARYYLELLMLQNGRS